MNISGLDCTYCTFC